jgi:hypothetical protein
MKTQKNNTVSIRLASLVAVARLAQVNDQLDLYTNIKSYIDHEFSNVSAKNKQVTNFLELVNQEFSDAIIPFTADELTIQVAAISLATKPSDGFRLFSNFSIIDVGYIKCTYEQTVFYDHLNIDDPDKKLPIFPDLGIPSDLLSYFSDFPESKAKVSFLHDGGDMIGIDINEVANKVFMKNKYRLKLALCKVPEVGSTSLRQLGNIKLELDKDGKHFFQLTSEQQLEVHAASFSEGWLLLGDAENGLFSPVPDLDPEAPSKLGYITFPSTITRDFTGKDSVISIEENFAQSLFNRYEWITPIDQDAWFSFVHKKSRTSKELL